MHEFSICENLVKIAREELDKLEHHDVHLLKMRVMVGELHAIVNENLQMAYSVLTRDTKLQDSTLELIRVPVVAECKDCGHQNQIQNNFFVCSKCESGNLEIIKGKELYIENLEVVYDENGD
jgi:hydrogenase nickel incorporation protein HypA/HybF